MGYFRDTSVQIDVVATILGKGHSSGSVRRQLPKTRVWLLADRTAVIITPNVQQSDVLREVRDIESAVFKRAEQTMVISLDGGETLVVDGKGCGCGFGVVANAVPTDEPHRLVNVRHPDWYQEN